MEELICRLLPYAESTGPANMAADELLARRAAAEGRAALRFYGWTPPTLSLGYFQPATVRLSEERLARLPWMRRPSGGATLVHHHELTYALTVPPGRAWHSEEPWSTRMHRIIVQALEALGLAGHFALATAPVAKHHDVLCFLQHTPGDVLCRGHKIAGSAQRKYHQTLLQHGAILLSQSEYTPALPGLRELTGTTVSASDLCQPIVAALARDAGWRMDQARWSDGERAEMARIEREKYASAAWNERR